MTPIPPVDRPRGDSLDLVERSERNARFAFVAAGVVEVGFLAAFLLLADFSNRLHVLLLLATVAIYTILALGLVALGAHVSRNTQRVLKALELLAEREDAPHG